MNGKAAVLAVVLACGPGILPPAAAAEVPGLPQAQGSKWRDTAWCAASLFLPLGLWDITARTCARAIVHWIE